PSDAIEARIREKAEKLEQFYDHIMGCRVMVEAPHGHHHQGRLYQVRIDLTVPDGELVTTHEHHHRDHAHEDVYVAIRDAFDTMKRQLQDHVRKRRGKVKQHEAPAGGHVISLHPEEDYGKIGTPDGREVYFHRNSVVKNAYDSLTVGSEVRFTEEAGESGPQATSVTPVGKHHVVL
ncbi:MAG: HPF/RaiA family ribosome-associated protein, partial [Thiohalobacterales bacterium]|nr:HPF/RaiA family ribosome-associated protein [Thiohalobacterales bacterium]